jgi:UDPglucose 6-dehydrogenase
VNICVQGLWHLGAVTAACMASLGHRVVGLDADLPTVMNLRTGIPPIYEPDLSTLVNRGLATGLLTFSNDPEKALRDIEILWITYDTPVDENDNANPGFVIAEIEKVLPYLACGTTILVSSQLPVGSSRRLENIISSRFSERKISVACSPENLRLGKALDAFLRPGRIVAGVRTARDHERLERLLQSITGKIEWMSVESAEMTKHAINAFLAASITFANEIASICERTGADAKEVERGLKTEDRIGPRAYLSPGAAFAGGTLARDIAFLGQITAANGIGTPLIAAVKTSNNEHRRWIERKLQLHFADLSRIKVVIWGLTYKPGTDTLRRSTAVELCDWLIEMNAELYVHDPAVKELPLKWGTKVQWLDNPTDGLTGAHALVIATEWPQYREIPPDIVATAAPGILVIDANRFLVALAKDDRLIYRAVGTPS